MIIADAHCDTLTRLMESGESLYSNSHHLDIERMKQSGDYVQFFAAFVHPRFGPGRAFQRVNEILDGFYEHLNKNVGHISLCLNVKQIEDAIQNKKVAALLSVENGSVLEGKTENLHALYNRGVRSICLTWNDRNEIGEGVGGDLNKGLTDFGVNVVREMNRLGMVIDVSHLTPAGFWDVMKHSSKPVIASHSNAKKLCSHRRNLDDSQLDALREKGGWVGVNFYPYFLRNDNIEGACIKDIISQIEYLSSRIGVDSVGIGSDFDGIDITPTDLTGVQDVERIFNELARLNYSEEQIEGIAGKNLIRVMKKILCGTSGN